MGIDQFSPPHKLGSTHGDTRITRQAIGEGAEYVPLVLRSYEIWDEIEKETGQQLLFKVGGLIMANDSGPSSHHGINKFVKTTIDAAKEYQIEHQVLESNDIQSRFPQFETTTQERGYYEKNAGYLVPEACVETQLNLAQKLSAKIRLNEKVVNWKVLPSGIVQVTTDKDVYQTEKLILTAGSWISQLLSEKFAQYFKVYRQVLYWFDFNENDYELFKNMPVFIWEFGGGHDDFIYGFPAINGPKGGVKVASEQYQEIVNPDQVNRAVDQKEIEEMYQRYIHPYMPKLGPRCLKAVSCLYTVTPDYKFVIDFHPEQEQIIIASPCSGHGFKHSSAIGEVLSELAVDGKSQIDISSFSMKRFLPLK